MTFTKFLNGLLQDMQLTGREGTFDIYLATYRSVLAFAGNPLITLKEVFTKEFLHQYQTHLLDKGRCYNTISAYMRVLRAIRNKAERQRSITTVPDLFDNLYTGIEPTRKRAMTAEAILKVNDVDLSDHAHLIMSRDLFMLSFHLQGISFIDLAHLRKTDLKKGYITYHRRKTGGLIEVEVLLPARKLLDQYISKNQNSPYLLELLTGTAKEPKKEYKTLLRRYNRHLKIIAGISGIEENLTSYVARHSWATAAYHIGVPTTMISEAMGHKTEEVTRIYLAAFKTETLAHANKMVLEAVFEGKTTEKQGREIKEKRQKRWQENVSFLARKGHESDAKLKRTMQIRKHTVS